MNRELPDFVRGVTEEWRHYGLAPWVAGKVVLVAVAVALAAGAAYALRPPPRAGRRADWAAGLALVAAAFALRWWLPVHALVHENRHGYGFVPRNPLEAIVQSHNVASAHLTLYGLFHALTPWPAESMFQMNACFSALAVGGTWFFAREAFGARLVAWTCACLLLLQPLAIALAPTEEFMVSAAGLALCGMAVLAAGARGGDRRLLAAGLALVGLAATSREVALPLAALAPVAILAGSDRSRPLPWRLALAASAALGVALLPQALNVLQANAADPHSNTIITPPHLPFNFGRLSLDLNWVGWQAPYIPRWMGWLIVVAVPAVFARAAQRRDPRLALAGGLTVVIAQAQGGLTGVGWFPSNMRHQYLAMAMAMLPVGWLIGSALEWVRARAPRAGRGAWGVALAAGAATLAAAPAGYRIDLPTTQEYRFLRGALGSVPPGARLYYLDLPVLGYGNALANWFQANVRDLDVRPVERVASRAADGDPRPSFLLIDRSCFLNAACFDGRTPDECFRPEVRAAQPLVPGRFGRMHPACRSALDAAPWREVAGRDLRTPSPAGAFYYDLPSADAVVHVALLALPPGAP
jgi:hypothetical protein